MPSGLPRLQVRHSQLFTGSEQTTAHFFTYMYIPTAPRAIGGPSMASDRSPGEGVVELHRKLLSRSELSVLDDLFELTYVDAVEQTDAVVGV